MKTFPFYTGRYVWCPKLPGHMSTTKNGGSNYWSQQESDPRGPYVYWLFRTGFWDTPRQASARLGLTRLSGFSLRLSNAFLLVRDFGLDPHPPNLQRLFFRCTHVIPILYRSTGNSCVSVNAPSTLSNRGYYKWVIAPIHPNPFRHLLPSPVNLWQNCRLKHNLRWESFSNLSFTARLAFQLFPADHSSPSVSFDSCQPELVDIATRTTPHLLR